MAARIAGESEMRFADQVVIVTGGAQGIGRACVEAFAAERASVVIADIDAEGGEKAAEAITGGGGRAQFVQTDVGDAGQAQRLIDQTLAAFGRLDVLINNAGIIKTAEFLEISEADFDAVLRVNLKGVFLVGQAAARVMVRQGRGAIINMSSANAVVAIPNQVPYVTSKGAVNQLTKVMALALADKGVRVNAIGPGSILTDLLKVVMSDEAARQRILSRTPMGRCGEPAEVAKVALFLASDDASYLTGQCIYPDGGRLALNYTVPVPA
jgi:glucose 1-dehydrogenase